MLVRHRGFEHFNKSGQCDWVKLPRKQDVDVLRG